MQQPNRETIRLAQAGDREAFEKVWRSYRDYVTGVCRKFSETQQDAEDATQETFLYLLGNIGSFREESQLSTWIYAVARAKSLDLLKKRSGTKRHRRFFVSIDSVDLIDPSIDLDNKIFARELTERLTDLNRTIAEDFYFYGYTHQEISGKIGLSTEAVKHRLDRLRRKLRLKEEPCLSAA